MFNENPKLTHVVQLDFSKFEAVDVIKIDGQEGVFIPFAANDILKTRKKGMLMSLKLFEQLPNPKGYTHYLKPYIKGNKDTGIVGRLLPTRFAFDSNFYKKRDKFKF